MTSQSERALAAMQRIIAERASYLEPEQPVGKPSSAYLRRVLIAIQAIHRRDEPITIRAIMREMGLRSIGSICVALHILREGGYVTFEDGHSGTLRYTEPRLYE